MENRTLFLARPVSVLKKSKRFEPYVSVFLISQKSPAKVNSKFKKPKTRSAGDSEGQDRHLKTSLKVKLKAKIDSF